MLPAAFTEPLTGVLDAEAKFRGMSPQEMASKILSKALPFATLAATLDGLEYAVEQRLEAASDEAGVDSAMAWFNANLEGISQAARS